jgi:hypothetical protein
MREQEVLSMRLVAEFGELWETGALPRVQTTVVVK